MNNNWVPSRYTRSVRLKGKGSLLYNSYSGAIVVIEPNEEEEVRNLLAKGMHLPEISSPLKNGMKEAGFLVKAGTDELGNARQLHDTLKETKSMHLVIMPTEACNFRCTYCYQTFPRGAMTREIINGLKAYVHQVTERIEHLSISWFGGEPMLAFDAIIELSDSFMKSCASMGIDYSADMSTNGYFLTKERFKELLYRNVRRFMVTLDGKSSVHDQRRKLAGGGGTFEKIMDNLKTLREIDESYTIDVRVNFDEDNVEDVPELLQQLCESFAGDKRFQLLVRPVGRWGGPQDNLIPVCDRTAADTHLWEMTDKGMKQGLELSETIADILMPSGAVCYAAKPNSLVVGANGSLYKCSIALEDEANQIGRLHADGSMELDTDKVARWTDSGEEQDAVCQACFFRPACQGNHCPLYRIRTGKRPCPHEKRQIKQVLHLLWKNAEPDRWR
ncbi:radical SAM/SPASM domain-containing protein [Paenibacillus crassostreae]|uniref:radical SAM/SPASM domain-containing protein n=1 Tax=Paenibacillus crassostreae TaxID=1763538 RepID=UPI000A632480|nr:radical SAM protein [Paenibacillus crassostreae]